MSTPTGDPAPEHSAPPAAEPELPPTTEPATDSVATVAPDASPSSPTADLPMSATSPWASNTPVDATQPYLPPPGYPQPGYPQPGTAQWGYPPVAYPQPGYPPAGYAQPGYPQPGYPPAGYAQPGYAGAEAGYAQAGWAVPGQTAGWSGAPGDPNDWTQPAYPQRPPFYGWNQQPKAKPWPKGLVITLVTVAALLLVGFGVGVPIFAGVRAARTVTDAARPAGTGSDHLHTGNLDSYVIPAPVDAEKWDTQPTDQDLDVSTAAGLVDPLGDESELSADSFKAGHVRRWVNDQGTIVELTLLQFDSALDGSLYYKYFTEQSSNGSGSWGDGEAVPGITDGTEYTEPKASDDTIFKQGVALAGDIVIVVTTDQKSTAGSDVNTAILTTQYARL